MADYDQLKLEWQLTAPANQVYSDWLDSEKHTAFTGGEAHMTHLMGQSFSAWDGYITGKNLDLVPGKQIIQSWRTDEFPEDAPDSQVEIILHDKGLECVLELIHTNIPPGDGPKYDSGWIEFYQKPMTDYYSE